MASFPPDAGHAATPPVLPPKPGSHEASRLNTPPGAGAYGPGGQPQQGGGGGGGGLDVGDGRRVPGTVAPAQTQVPDPGDQWLPQILQDKSKQDLTELLSNPALLHALAHSPDTIHPSLSGSHRALQTALAENVDLAQHLQEHETRLARQRAASQAQLLSTHALERQWQQKQSGMDHALAPFAPASLYQQLAHGVQEQGAVCQAMEESFLDGGGEGSGGGGGGDGAGDVASEKDVSDWVRRYREARVLYYLRQERKERWDEGRVGGWR